MILCEWSDGCIDIVMGFIIADFGGFPYKSLDVERDDICYNGSDSYHKD